jgi:hypothetical protein
MELLLSTRPSSTSLHVETQDRECIQENSFPELCLLRPSAGESERVEPIWDGQGGSTRKRGRDEDAFSHEPKTYQQTTALQRVQGEGNSMIAAVNSFAHERNCVRFGLQFFRHHPMFVCFCDVCFCNVKKENMYHSEPLRGLS